MSAELRVGDLVPRNAARMPGAPALIHEGTTISWRALDCAVNRVASGLDRIGVRRGQRVATITRNGPTAVELLFATGKSGLIGVPISFGLTEAETAVLLEDSEPHCIIVAGEFVPKLAPILSKRGCLVVVENPRERLPEGWVDLAQVMADGADAYEDPGVGIDDVRNIRYTSGTTATPKGLLSTHRQIFTSIENFFRQVPVSDGPFLQLLPLSSGAGIWMQLASAKQGVPSVLQSAFHPVETLRLLQEYRVVHAYGVPTIVSRLTEAYAAGDFDLSSFKLLGYGGSPMPPSTIRRAMATLPCDFYHGFGGGEMGGLVSYLMPEEHRAAVRGPEAFARLSSVGQPAAYAEIRIRDDAGNVLPAETVGEITVRSPSNFSGYWKRERETAQTLRNGWVYTGDLGYFDGEGFLYAVDRKKDMVLTGGMNVSSAEVEAVLLEHADVAEVAVIGIPDEEWGECVTAVVVRRDAAGVEENELICFARERLAGYKTPKRIEFVDALPLNSAGKVLKRALRQRFTTSA